jgi:hypothetical protein
MRCSISISMSVIIKVLWHPIYKLGVAFIIILSNGSFATKSMSMKFNLNVSSFTYLGSLGITTSNGIGRVSLLKWKDQYFVQLAFSLSNGVTDTLESSKILFYSRKHMSLYTQNVGRMLHWLNGWLKVNERVEAGTVNKKCGSSGKLWVIFLQNFLR